jgi:hypothetical protein
VPATVWVFVATRATLPSAVFADEDIAAAWIRRHSLTGLLTEYPIDVSVYDWVIAKGYWKPNEPYQHTPAFIGKFTSAYLRHRHFEDGVESSGERGQS